jgi:hypothetical protein
MVGGMLGMDWEGDAGWLGVVCWEGDAGGKVLVIWYGCRKELRCSEVTHGVSVQRCSDPPSECAQLRVKLYNLRPEAVAVFHVIFYCEIVVGCAIGRVGSFEEDGCDLIPAYFESVHYQKAQQRSALRGFLADQLIRGLKQNVKAKIKISSEVSQAYTRSL